MLDINQLPIATRILVDGYVQGRSQVLAFPAKPDVYVEASAIFRAALLVYLTQALGVSEDELNELAEAEAERLKRERAIQDSTN